jgi:hypothetical protein
MENKLEGSESVHKTTDDSHYPKQNQKSSTRSVSPPSNRSNYIPQKAPGK